MNHDIMCKAVRASGAFFQYFETRGQSGHILAWIKMTCIWKDKIWPRTSRSFERESAVFWDL